MQVFYFFVMQVVVPLKYKFASGPLLPRDCIAWPPQAKNKIQMVCFKFPQ
jgi:hypothetical protein